MKVIVSHSQKQHVYRMVYGLKINQKLQYFFTALFFTDNSIWTKLFQSNKRTEKLVKKRTFAGIDKNEVKLTLFPELFFQSMRFFMPRLRGYYMDRIHDDMVSWVLPFNKYDVIIGYERQCLKSFQKAKEQGKVTILDLASIHAQKQREINAQYNNILTGFQPSSLLGVEKGVKEKEFEYTDYIITLSKFAKDSCIEAGIPKEKIFNVQLGIDIVNFHAKITYDLNNFEILFVSAVRHWKGIKDLIEVFTKLNLSGAKLTVVGGGGDALDYVLAQVNENITYIPYLHHNELKEVYRRASVFVLPSYMDSWAQVVCEAMSCGTPVIVSKNTGAKDIITNNESGFIIETASQTQLAEKINYFYKNRSEIEKMGRNARKAVEHLTWKNYYEQIDRIMKTIGSKT